MGLTLLTPEILPAPPVGENPPLMTHVSPIFILSISFWINSFFILSSFRTRLDRCNSSSLEWTEINGLDALDLDEGEGSTGPGLDDA